MDRNELNAICKEKKVFQWQIADKLGISEPTFIRWMRHPVSDDLEIRVMDAINAIVSEREQKEGR